jgi:hypothetical protein
MEILDAASNVYLALLTTISSSIDKGDKEGKTRKRISKIVTEKEAAKEEKTFFINNY